MTDTKYPAATVTWRRGFRLLAYGAASMGNLCRTFRRKVFLAHSSLSEENDSARNSETVEDDGATFLRNFGHQLALDVASRKTTRRWRPEQ